MMFFFPLKNIFVGNHDNQSELTVFINLTHLRKKKDSISVSFTDEKSPIAYSHQILFI